MKSALNNACISALLSVAVVFALPTFAANTPAGVSTSTGVSTSGDLETPDLGNNAGSVNLSTQQPARHMSKKAITTTRKARAQNVRQLNQRRVNPAVGGSASVQQ
jgi:hypothetical protein